MDIFDAAHQAVIVTRLFGQTSVFVQVNVCGLWVGEANNEMKMHSHTQAFHARLLLNPRRKTPSIASAGSLKTRAHCLSKSVIDYI